MLKSKVTMTKNSKPEWLSEALDEWGDFFKEKDTGPPTPPIKEKKMRRKIVSPKEDLSQANTSEIPPGSIPLSPEDFLSMEEMASHFGEQLSLPESLEEETKEAIEDLPNANRQADLNTHLLFQVLRSNEKLAQLLSVISTKLIEVTLEKANGNV
jgi:hypothetical protein